MRITFIGHAGFVVETAGALVVMDPWLSPRGAFDSAWMQFPRNHYLAPKVRDLLEHCPKQRFLYVSHNHKDHFDPEFLETVTRRDFTVLIPRFRKSELWKVFQVYGSRRVIACEDRQELPLPGGGYLKLFLTESETDRDSGLLVRGDRQSFLKINGSALHDRLASIVAENGPVDVFTAQHSGAGWHPVCYEYPREAVKALSIQKRDSRFEAVARAIDTVKPRSYLASAGPACFLDPALFHLNLETVSVFPRAPVLFDYLRQRLPAASTRYIEPMPGDVLDVTCLELTPSESVHVTDQNLEAYLRTYAAEQAHLFQARRRNMLRTEVDEIHDLLRVELRRKLDLLERHGEVGTPLYMMLKEAPGRLLRVDFHDRQVEVVPAIRDICRYTLTASAVDIARVLERKLTWEDFLQSMRHRMSRNPDVDEPILHAFLKLEVDDLLDVCDGGRAQGLVTRGQGPASLGSECPRALPLQR
jgi:UDP-MurNAc hydroxylase